MYCKKCGRKREAGEVFCIACGNKFQNEPKSQNKSKLPLVIVGVVSLLLIICLIVFAAILLTGSNNSKKTSNSNTFVEEAQSETELEPQEDSQIKLETEAEATEGATENATEVAEETEIIEQEQPVEAVEAVETEQEAIAQEPAVESWQAYYYRKIVTEDYFGIRESEWGADSLNFYFLYIDEDDIPELYVTSIYGDEVMAYCNGNSSSIYTDSECGIDYLERGRLVAIEDGKMGYYSTEIYSLENGQFREVGYGTIHFLDAEWETVEYTWNDVEVDQTEYYDHINTMLPENEKISFYPEEDGMTYDTFCSMLEEALASEQ